MLPRELLEVRKFKGKMFPKFAGSEEYGLAERVIEIFRAARGKKYGAVLKALRSIEDARNFRKVRGFARVVENHCVEKVCNSELDPVRVRTFLFERGFVTTRKERDRVIRYAARYFNTAPETIERAMYADREEELVVDSVGEMTPEDLVKLYNLSLLQTALFGCLRLTFWTSSNHKEIFRAIKWLGLMYDLYEDAGRLVVEVTGAASILKMTRKYGTAMAKLVPYILRARSWGIRAEIVDGDRVYVMEMDDRHRELFPESEEKIEYDSSLEEGFARKLRALGYEVVREPGVVRAGRYAFIPDFLVRRQGEVYVELVGFWTQEYLRKKLEKVKQAEIPLIIVAREEFGKMDGVVLFSNRIPYAEVVRAIRRYMRDEVKFEGDVVRLDRVGRVPEGYVVAGGYAVKREVLERLKAEIKELRPKTLEEARPLLEKYGVGESVLPALGYRVRWLGLGEAVLLPDEAG